MQRQVADRLLDDHMLDLAGGPAQVGVVADHIIRLLHLGQELQVVTENLDPPNRMRLLVDSA